VTAGIFVPSDTTGHIPDDKWALTFGINVSGSYFVANEASKSWREQGLRGSLVLTTSTNAAVAQKGSVAYDTSKAAANRVDGGNYPRPPHHPACGSAPGDSERYRTVVG